MTNFDVDNEEAHFLEWKLRTVMPNGELSESFKTIRDAMNDGYVVKYETEETLHMLNPYNNWVEAFIIDKREDE